MKLGLVVAVVLAATLLLFFAFRSSPSGAKGIASEAQKFEERFPNLPKDALDRRSRSNAVMRSQAVPVNDWLPVIEAENDLLLPSTEQVAMRAAATLVVALKAHGMPQEKVDKLVREYRLTNQLSPNEMQFIRNLNATDNEREIQVWRYEVANALMWSLGFVDHLDGPRELVDPKKIASIIVDSNYEQFLAKARLRSKSEILDQADLIYRYRWALVDARLKGLEAPSGLSDDVAMERHQAFNWLIEHAEIGWDDISLDT
ncbi:DUF4272 domain-containing protein [Sphingobium phenoxybenzoativorans]|uniref:DUF4272 domain-containing protein n=1 Tax=Sphingobium phenoxybenzoativorans TaxID=1592790 RepID=UPI000AD68FCE|nr:DUF4272 domain-containing protein [Sphingobium phenoxybenzoativorans]